MVLLCTERGWTKVMNIPLVLPLLKVEVCGAKASILSRLLAQALHRLATGVHDFCPPPSVRTAAVADILVVVSQRRCLRPA
jgi:hypothetical protein